ncbi:hypothetical protein NA57DRAFT_55621 [Rhizodiscina lignyota]|uniref:Transcription initiation factor TFIID subunit 8 n=1 Tax=Rhizodiscina lignyota TaxID=1504668 RepID=A0A9P4IK79_9PEZI|nr:hypothetical protein NA57DRAFT_55621 [Rhizodiscina lignyota]
MAATISPPNSLKRSAEDLGDMENTPTKRRRLYHHHHAVRHKQQVPLPSDPSYNNKHAQLFDGQLERGLAIVLQSAGFAGAKPEALEMFRAQAEEYMLHFLSIVRQSMASSRRRQPIPHDFIRALAHHNLTSSSLEPHVKVPIPPLLAQQPILGPPPDEPVPPNLDAMLGDELNGKAEKKERKYIPKHFPGLPSKHTWQATPVFPKREEDPRKIRERATEEGVLVEQALRKLMAAKKRGLQKRRPLAAVEQNGAELQRKQVWDDALQAVLREDEEHRRRWEEAEDNIVLRFDGAAEKDVDAAGGTVKSDIGMLVNYDRKYWRKGAQERTSQG